MTDNELKEIFAKLALAQLETEAQFARTEEQFARTEEQFARTEAQFARTDAQIAKSEAKQDRMGLNLGNISNNNGYSTEEYFYNSLLDNPMLGGVEYDKIKKNVYSVTKKLEDQFDIVLYNGNCIALIECKYKAHENDLHKLIDKKVANFRTLFPDFEDYSIYLGLASFSFYEELETLAKQKGVAILKQKGDVVEIEAKNLKAY